MPQHPTIEKLDKSDMETQRSTDPTQQTNIVEFDVESGDDLDLSRKYNQDEESSTSSMSSTALQNHIWNRGAIVSAGIAIFGILAGSFFLSFGIANNNTLQESSFRLVADELAKEFGLAWEDYVTAAKWLHQACQYHPVNRTYFRDIFEHVSYDLNIQVCTFVLLCISILESSYIFFEIFKSFPLFLPAVSFSNEAT